MMSSFFLFPFNFPSFFSTVTPGQLPTYWLAPVKALNIVVLPQFGFPASAILIPIPIYLLERVNSNVTICICQFLR